MAIICGHCSSSTSHYFAPGAASLLPAGNGEVSLLGSVKQRDRLRERERNKLMRPEELIHGEVLVGGEGDLVVAVDDDDDD